MFVFQKEIYIFAPDIWTKKRSTTPVFNPKSRNIQLKISLYVKKICHT